MTLDLFINFNGNCKEAVDFYAKVFKSEVKNLMLYKDMPADTGYPVNPADKDKIMYADVLIGDKRVMFMDYPSNEKLIVGNNIVPALNVASKDEVDRLFAELSEGGAVEAAPGQTFFSEYYAMVTDKFGISWHIMVNE